MAQAHFGGAIRLVDPGSGESIRVHPRLARVYAISWSTSGNSNEIQLPEKGLTKLRAGDTLLVFNAGIGSSGVLTFFDHAGLAWDFAAAEWVETPSANCELDPGNHAVLRVIGFVPGTDAIDLGSLVSRPPDSSYVPLWYAWSRLSAPAAAIGYVGAG